jgi:mitochondrial fission protein ELM1
VQILDPRLPPSHWDVVVAPEHDGLPATTSSRSSAACIRSTICWLAQARSDSRSCRPLAQPRVALLLGGRANTSGLRRHRARRATCNRRPPCASRRRQPARHHVARTPPRGAHALRTAVRDIPGLRWFAPHRAGGDDSDNPIPACSRGPTASCAPPIR